MRSRHALHWPHLRGVEGVSIYGEASGLAATAISSVMPFSCSMAWRECHRLDDGYFIVGRPIENLNLLLGGIMQISEKQ